MGNNRLNLFCIAVTLLIVVFLISCCNCQAEGEPLNGDINSNSDDVTDDRCRHDSTDPSRCGGHHRPRTTPSNEDDSDDDVYSDDDPKVVWWPIVLGVIAGIAIITVIVVVVVRKRKPATTLPVPAANHYGSGPYKKEGMKMDGIQVDGTGLPPQIISEKTDPPPAYIGSKDSPDQLQDAGGMQPPPYTIQLPPYFPAENAYGSVNMMERSMTPVSY